jgi:hypothetical protein
VAHDGHVDDRWADTGLRQRMTRRTLRRPTARTVIIVSPFFPPSNLAGVHRARHLAKHLPATGWMPIALCVNESFYEQKLDHALAALVPENTQVVKTTAISAASARCLGVGDISLRAWWPLRRALIRLLETQPVGAVLITGSPFYTMLFAPLIKLRFGIPVVLDFQDPWVSAWGAAQSPRTKAGLAHKLATILEPQALRGANFVVSVSDTQNKELLSRYRWLDGSRIAAIPIGGDPDDFVALRVAPPHLDGVDLEPGYIHFSYVGTVWPAARSSIRTLLRAFRRLCIESPDLARRIRLNFVGTSATPNDASTFHVRTMAEAEGIADAVREFPRRLPYLSALAVLTQSNGVLLIGSDEPHYTASKIYPTLMSGRPFISLYHSASSAHSVLAAAGGGRTFAFATPEQLIALEAPLAEGLRTLAVAPSSLGSVNPAAYAPYEARAVACRFADIFDSLNANA